MTDSYIELMNKKNDFYRDRYRITLRLIMWMSLSAVGLSGLLGYLLYNQTTPHYYASTTTGNVVEIFPLSVPVVSSSYLLQWAEMVARSSLNFDFVHYPDQMKNLSQYFTTNAWDQFQNNLSGSGFIDNLTSQKMYVTSVVNKPPVILDTYVSGNRYTWLVQVPLLVTFQSASATQKKQALITMTITRVPVIEISKGIAIKDISIKYTGILK